MEKELELLWDGLLSRQPDRICEIFRVFDKEVQTSVLSHLNRMAIEDSWHPEQRKSARAALSALEACSQDLPVDQKSN
ncbi:MAG: hypothetical protein U9R58_12845 [Chloroflexota bacterium]|nr:hypothetical protein [Chloroflexota bacterium]